MTLHRGKSSKATASLNILNKLDKRLIREFKEDIELLETSLEAVNRLLAKCARFEETYSRAKLLAVDCETSMVQ